MSDTTSAPGAAGERERIIAVLVDEWDRIADLLGGLDDAAWSNPTVLPGWDVRDNVAHMIGTEAMLAGDPQPDPPTDVGGREHVRNDIGAVNEAWVDSLRGTAPAEVLERFREITARRAGQLRAMTDEQFDAPSWTPAGNDTYARFMKIRTFDCWFHEQDIREAVEVPGNEDGPAAVEALAEVVRALGYIVGKRGGAPAGSAVTIVLTGALPRELHVAVDGRAAVVDELDRPADVTITLDSRTFMRLAGGRVEARSVLDHIHLDGDVDLGSQIVGHLAYTI